MKRTSFLVLVLEGLVILHRTGQLQLLQHQWLGHNLNYYDVYGLPWKQIEILLLFLRFHPSTVFQTLVDYEGYSISSNGFLPMTVDIMLVWIEFTIGDVVAQMVKHLSTMRETWVWALAWEDPLEKEMAIHSSTIAWKIPWTEEPGRLQSMGSQRVGHDWVTSLSLSPILVHFTDS